MPTYKAAKLRESRDIFRSVHKKRDVVFIQKVGGPGIIKFDTYVGKRADLHCTSLGKVLLAYSSDAIVRDFLAADSFAKYTDVTITSRAAFKEELVKVRQKGYAVDDEEEEPGVRCVGVPVFNQLGELMSALSLTGTTAQVLPENYDKLVDLVKQASARISRALKIL